MVERTYQDIIDSCQRIAAASGENAVEKLEHLYIHYRSTVVSSDLDAYLHKPQNAGIHQKSLAKILTSLSPIIAQIIGQGNEEGLFHCAYPLELSETILSVFCFLLDPGIFHWTSEQIERKLAVLISLFENGLGVSKGDLDFFML